MQNTSRHARHVVWGAGPQNTLAEGSRRDEAGDIENARAAGPACQRHVGPSRRTFVSLPCFLGLLLKQPHEFVEIVIVNVRNCPVLHASPLPAANVVSLTGESPNGFVLADGRPTEGIDDVCPALVHRRGDRSVCQVVQTTARQREALRREIRHLGREVELSAEPRFHGVLICGDDVLQVLDLERTDMTIHDRRDESIVRGLPVVHHQE